MRLVVTIVSLFVSGDVLMVCCSVCSCVMMAHGVCMCVCVCPGAVCPGCAYFGSVFGRGFLEWVVVYLGMQGADVLPRWYSVVMGRCSVWPASVIFCLGVCLLCVAPVGVWFFRLVG